MMAERDGKRSGRGSRPERGDFDDRDLLVGHQKQAAASSAPDAPGTEAATLAHILATLRPMKARLDALQAGPGASDEAADALASARELLHQSVQEARGALAAAAAPDAKRRHEEAVSARLLADGARALEDQAAETGKRLERALEQERAVAGVVETLRDTAGRIDTGLAALEREVERRAAGRRRRGWLIGGLLAGAVAAAFVAGAVVQRETGALTLGDPRHAWHAFVLRHYAPRLAACASKARVDGRALNCQVAVKPPQEVTIPLPAWWPAALRPQQE